MRLNDPLNLAQVESIIEARKKQNSDVPVGRPPFWFVPGTDYALMALEMLAERLKIEDEFIPPFMPTGYITYWIHAQLPPDHLECYGQTLLIDEYPKLFLIIGRQFGGSETTFNLPIGREDGIAEPVPYYDKLKSGQGRPVRMIMKVK